MALQQAILPLEVRGRTRSIRLILLCQVLTLAVWFASTAALPSIAVLEPISETQMALMTSVLQVGFVIGALLSAFLNVADRFDPRNLFAASAAVAAVTTAALLVVSPVGTEALILRALTGVALAGIYPVGMRMVASWATNDLGKLVGLLVGALTIGSALPHLFTIGDAWDWKLVYAASSIAALSAACLVKFAKLGPAFKRAQRFDPNIAKAAWLKRPVRLGQPWIPGPYVGTVRNVGMDRIVLPGIIGRPGSGTTGACPRSHFPCHWRRRPGGADRRAFGRPVWPHRCNHLLHGNQWRLRADGRMALRRATSAYSHRGHGLGNIDHRRFCSVLSLRGGTVTPGIGRDHADHSNLHGLRTNPRHNPIHGLCRQSLGLGHRILDARPGSTFWLPGHVAAEA